MLIDIRNSEIAEMEFLITKKQLRKLLKERVYDLFGLNQEMGLQKYSNKQYMEAIQGTIASTSDTLIDMLEDFAKAPRETQHIIASFSWYRMLHYFDDEISVTLRKDFKDNLITNLFQTAKARLISDSTGMPSIKSYQYRGLGGKLIQD